MRMRRTVRRLALAAAASGALTSAAGAQDANDSLGWRFVGDLGYVQTAGNTRLSTVNVGSALSYRPDRRWTLAQTAAWINGRTNGAETANQVLAGVRADYGVTGTLAAYGLVAYERNPYAGIGRRFEESAGLSYQAVRTPRHSFQVDVGVGGNQQVAAGVSSSFVVARLAPRYRYTMGGRAYIEERLEFLANLDDTGDLRTRSSTNLVAPLTTSISIRLGYFLRHDAEPAPGFRKLDTTFTTGIQLTL